MVVMDGTLLRASIMRDIVEGEGAGVVPRACVTRPTRIDDVFRRAGVGWEE